MLQRRHRRPDARRRAGADKAVDAWGGIDVWINNAAALMVKPFLEMTDDDWHGLLRGEPARLLLRLPRGRARDGAGSGGADHQRDLGGRHPADRRALGLRHGQGRHPGADEDAGGRARPARRDRQRALARARRTRRSTRWPTPRPCGATYEERIPLGRIAASEEVADAILFLASDAARYVNGHELMCDGGLILNGNVGHARSDSRDRA